MSNIKQFKNKKSAFLLEQSRPQEKTKTGLRVDFATLTVKIMT